MYPEGLKYSEEHEWVKAETEGRVRVGISHYAQKELGDVVFVELPEVGTTLTAGAPFAVVESVKAVSDIYTPVSGTVIEVNDSLNDQPEMVNEEPYGQGWIAVIEMSDAGQLDGLMDGAQYKEHVGE